jgi:hypothetical protein
VTEVDPDPHDPADAERASVLGNGELPAGDDPTDGGKRGQIGDGPSVRSDEPSDGEAYPVGGGSVVEETDAAPDSYSGADA